MTQNKLGGAHIPQSLAAELEKGTRDRSTVEGVGCAGIEHVFTCIPSKLEGKWGYYIQINNLLLQIYANSVLNRVIGVNLNLKSIRKCY